MFDAYLLKRDNLPRSRVKLDSMLAETTQDDAEDERYGERSRAGLQHSHLVSTPLSLAIHRALKFTNPMMIHISCAKIFRFRIRCAQNRKATAMMAIT